MNHEPAIVALVGDLIDRSRLQGALPGIRFAGTPTAAASAGGDVVVIDLTRFSSAVASLRSALPDARIVCFGPHVDDAGTVAARQAGADLVVPRSRFFRQIGACVLGRQACDEPDPDAQIIGQG